MIAENVLYSVENLPLLQNRLYENKEEALNCLKSNVTLVENLETGLIYNSSFNSELMRYDEKYNNEQGLSELFQLHLENVSNIIERLIGKQNIVEVGCGKGFFLELLQSKNFDIYGFDPTYDGYNPKIQKKYFSSNLIKKSDGLILRHVLEHIQNPIEFLEQLKISNGNFGKIYIEVPCFDWICSNKAWFDIFYEHVNYFRLSDFDRMFDKIIESGKIFGGQYIYVIAELSSLKRPKIDLNNRIKFPFDFNTGIYKNEENKGNFNLIWGAASKGVIFALLKSRIGQNIETIVDINPAKQEMYIPGTGFQVKSPENILKRLNNKSYIYIMNSNYINEIKRITDFRCNYIAVDRDF